MKSPRVEPDLKDISFLFQQKIKFSFLRLPFQLYILPAIFSKTEKRAVSSQGQGWFKSSATYYLKAKICIPINSKYQYMKFITLILWL